MEEDIRKFEGKEYDYNYMMEAVKKYPKVKENLTKAKDELAMAKSSVEDAEMQVDDAEIEWNNLISEWEDFPPFKEALKSHSSTTDSKES